MSGIAPAGARVVVTGAGSGIGKATALRYAAMGAASVACADIDGAGAEATAAACRERGAEASAHTCDVAEWSAVAGLADEVEAAGPVDIAVNNAGVGVAGPYLEQSVADWDWLIGINLNGVAYGCRAFGAAMVERGRGQIVNVASGAGYIASKHLAAYCATKAAVIMFSQCLRADLGGEGVGVSAICPGVIDTPIASRTRYRGALESKRARAEGLLGHGQPPRAVADAIVEAARKDHRIVPVGIESQLGFRLLRFAPGPIQGLVANRSL